MYAENIGPVEGTMLGREYDQSVENGPANNGTEKNNGGADEYDA